MRVLWVAHNDDPGLHADPAQLCRHWSAGRRLRVGIPASWMSGANIEQRLMSPPSADGLRQALAFAPDVAVISGLYPNIDARRDARSYFDCAEAFHRAGVPVVVDLAENHFQDFRADEYREMIGLGDGLIVNTQALADVIAEQTGRSAAVIGDPVEGACRDPAFDPPALPGAMARLIGHGATPRPLKLLWFGGQERNYEYLRLLVPELTRFAERQPLHLAIVVGPNSDIDADVAGWRNPSAGLDAGVFAWSGAVLERELAGCDLVIIPSDVRARMAASTNRLTQSIWAGRFVVANGLPSYWEFRQAAWIGESIVEGMRWALQHRDEALARVGRGQSIIAGHYTPEAIGRSWQTALAGFTRRQT